MAEHSIIIIYELLLFNRLNVLMQDCASATIEVVSISQLGSEEAMTDLLNRAVKVGPLAALFFVNVVSYVK